MADLLAKQYAELKALASQNLAGGGVASLICEMATEARATLAKLEPVPLRSSVPGKTYFGYRAAAESRPINTALYVRDQKDFGRRLKAFLTGLADAEAATLVGTTYTMAMSVFAAHDIKEVGRKASATFFEILIGHMVARALRIAPRRKVRLPESEAELPTDYVFDLGKNKPKLHLPIKTSTRERAVQAWVHQLVLERIFGSKVYKGVLVVSGETKRNARTGVVTEICIPRQLQMFQSRVAELTRVYYLDPPQVYLALSQSEPRVEVRSFGHIFGELRDLLKT